MRYLLTKIIILILGDETMMALLFAQRVILEKNTFDEVPRLLKKQVYEHLVDSGMEHLAGDYDPEEDDN